MTEKIFEYKDKQNWYLGKWGDYPYITAFTEREDYDFVHQLLAAVSVSDETFLQLHVARHRSDFQLLSFVIHVVNETFHRHLSISWRGSVLLVTEEDCLLFVHLPEGGVAVDSFFAGAIKESLLIATRNEGKTREFRAIFAKLGYEVENLNDYPDLPEVAETGTTFEENARLKAETISQMTGKMVLADDSGLKVDVLGGLPGVWSARFAGVGATDNENNAKLLHELTMVFEKKDRTAQFHTTLVVASPGKDSLVVEAEWPGYIAFQPQGENGFGYDPLFLVGEGGKTSAELTLEEKNAQSHRARAVKKLVEVFPEWQSKQLL